MQLPLHREGSLDSVQVTEHRQVLRTVMASVFKPDAPSKKQLASFHRDGYLAFPAIFTNAALAGLSDEILYYPNGLRKGDRKLLVVPGTHLVLLGVLSAFLFPSKGIVRSWISMWIDFESADHFLIQLKAQSGP